MPRCHRLAPLLLLAAAVAAPAAPDVDEFARLVEGDETQRAWEYAQAHRDGLEGDPEFDLLYGIAAVEAGHPREAVFALRRVLAVRPGHGRARVALARAHFDAGNDLLARRELERLLASNPPEPLRAAAERYLWAVQGRASRYRTVVSGHLAFGGGHDSNVNSATSLESVDSPDGTLRIDEQGREQADDFVRLAGRLRIEHPLTPGIGGFASLAGERRYHDETDQLELGSALLRAGLRTRGDRTRASLGLHAQAVELDGAAYRDMSGLDADLRWALSETRVLGLSARYSRLDYDDRDESDADLVELGARATSGWRLPLRPVLSVSLSLGEERARRDTAEARARTERDLYGAGAVLRFQPASRWRLSGRLHYQRSEYAAVDPLFDERREDDYHSARLQLEWRTHPDRRVQLRLTRVDNDSNLDLHDHEREVAELRLRHDFRH